MSEPPKQRFFQAPLAILRYGANQQHKIDGIIAWGAISAGQAVEAKLGTQVARAKIEEMQRIQIAITNTLQRAWALGKDVVGYCWHEEPHHCVEIYKEVRAFLERLPQSPIVRVPTDLIQDVHKEQFPFREFTVLMAVYAVIGDKKYAIVRRDRVRAGALGYNSGSDLFDDAGQLTVEGKVRLTERPDNAQPLTTDQARYSLNWLHARKFFSRLNPRGPSGGNSRRTFYSRSISHDELAELLGQRLTRKSEAWVAQQAAQDKLRKSMALLKRGQCGENGERFPAQSPGNPQSVPGGVPA